MVNQFLVFHIINNLAMNICASRFLPRPSVMPMEFRFLEVDLWSKVYVYLTI